MAQCDLCRKRSGLISRGLRLCLSCIRERPAEALERALDVHGESRAEFGLPEKPPRGDSGVSCGLCLNRCRIPEGKRGYCGLWENRGGVLTGSSEMEGKFSWHHDPLPTNCVGSWVCPGGTGAGFPECANCRGPERGYRNLAVYFHACNFNCLYCQNWEFRYDTTHPFKTSKTELISAIDDKTSCVCWFGGDPTPQLPFSLAAASEALKRQEGKILRLCWETNGSMDSALLDRMLALAIESCGVIKFDLKAWDKTLHMALTGVSNSRTLENFRRAGGRIPERPDPPLIIASTCLVPGYIDREEVSNIARFIATVNPDIPYALLGFSPQFRMDDLPPTPKNLAKECLAAAREAGLTRVRLENTELLT